MAGLIDAITADLCGTDDPRIRGDADVPGALRRLVADLGSIAGAARVLAVPRTTLRGWLTGRRPKRGPQAIIAAARGVLTARRKPGYYEDAYRGRKTLVIDGIVRFSSDVRPRKIHVGRYIPKQTMQGILRAWAAADDDRAERLLYNAIDKHYEGVFIDEITRTWFE